MFGLINTTLLWAMAAVALPLLIHLLSRRKLKVVTVSTIAFLKRLESENVRKLKIRQLLLLLLRMLIVALLVLAFARPTLRSNNFALAEKARTTAVLIIDNSLSMAIAPDGMTSLELAKRHGQKMIDLFSTSDEIYLITASQPAVVIPGSPFLNHDRLIKVLNSIQQTWGTTDISDAVALAHKILGKSLNINRELYLLSDCRDMTLSDLDELHGVRGYIIRYDADVTNNLALTQISHSNQIYERGKSFEVTATVSNNNKNDQNGRLIHLYLNDKRIAQQSINVPAGSQRLVTLRAVPDSTGFVSGRIELEDDNFLLDNTRYFNFSIAPTRRLLAVGESNADLLYLRAALRIDSQNKGNQQVSTTWKAIQTKDFSSENFEEYDGIVLSNMARFPQGTASRIIEYLNNGGGVIILPGSDVDLRHYNETLLSKIKFGAFGETFGNLGDSKNFIKLGKVDFSHPLFDGVFEKSDEIPKIDSPHFWFAAQLRLAPGTASIIDYSNQYPFLAEKRIGEGRIIIFTSSMDQRWSNFSFKGLFAPLIYRSVVYITQSRENLHRSSFIGNELTTIIGTPSKELTAELPDKERIKAPVQVSGQHYNIRIQETKIPGFYKLYEKNNNLVHMWSVNFNADELLAAPAENKKIAAAFGIPGMTELTLNGDLLTQIEQARYGTELWRIFLIAALLAMVIEMLLYRSTGSRKDKAENPPKTGEVKSSKASYAN